MNKLIAVAALSLAALSPCAHAAGSGSGVVVTGVGQWIAAQGNAALRQIRDELRRDLHNHLQPIQPEAPQASADVVDRRVADAST